MDKRLVISALSSLVGLAAIKNPAVLRIHANNLDQTEPNFGHGITTINLGRRAEKQAKREAKAARRREMKARKL